uniref:Metalloendopeptidase-like membrane protein n=1 Tax=Desulfovibrio sp. U5L TaxID=596152 RepID=I2Q2W0_9BACT
MSLPDGMGDLAATAAMQDDVAQKLRVDALQKGLSGGKTKEAKLREACQGFESVFISQLFAKMRATVPKDGILHGHYEDQYYSMFDKAMSDKMAADGGIGLADMMYRQLKGKVLGQDEGVAGKGDIVPANRLAPAHIPAGQAGHADPALAASGQAGAAGLPEDDEDDDGAAAADPTLATALARPGVDSLAASHDRAQATPVDPAAAAAQAAVPLSAPVTGDITSEYGWRSDPFKGKRAWHAGMDIAAASGSQVSACWDGTVVFAGTKGGYGNVVEIEHPGGWKSVYGHLRDYSVKAGDTVAAGGKIAEVGSTGRSTGPHLHFELRRGGETVDPETMLAGSGLLQGVM